MTPKKFFFAACAGLVLTVGAVGYALYWGDSQLGARADEIAGLNKEVEVLNAKIKNAKSLESELKQYEEISQLTKEVLPDSKTQENIVGELISITAKRNITLESINFVGGQNTTTNPELNQAEPVDDIPGVFALQLSTSFISSYSNILDLLRDLETNKRRFEVTDISISPNVSEAQDGNFSASIEIVTYIKP